MKNDQTTVIIALIVILVLFFVGGFGMMGFGHMMNGYGIRGMCSTIGGIWCYWPSWAGVTSFIVSLLTIVALILLIIWLYREINNPKKWR
jgi:flagellar biogenesis protein FliO